MKDPRVWVPIATLLIGFAISQVAEALREQRHERKSALERKLNRQEQAASVQGSRLAALQEALQDLHMEAARTTAAKISGKTGDLGAVYGAYIATIGLIERVADADIRVAANKAADLALNLATSAKSGVRADYGTPIDAFSSATKLIGQRIRQLESAD